MVWKIEFDPATARELGAFWKYRVGYYRIISNIEDGRLLILVIRIGNCREVYRR
jgi:addiction module toxin, relE/stbE family